MIGSKSQVNTKQKTTTLKEKHSLWGREGGVASGLFPELELLGGEWDGSSLHLVQGINHTGNLSKFRRSLWREQQKLISMKAGPRLAESEPMHGGPVSVSGTQSLAMRGARWAMDPKGRPGCGPQNTQKAPPPAAN